MKLRNTAHHAKSIPHPHKILPLVATIICGILVFTGTGIALVYRDLNSQIKTVKITTDSKPRIADSDYSDKPINVLVLGSDARSSSDSDAASSPGQRSDTAFIVHINAKKTQADIISIPRDTMVKIPVCDKGNGTKYYGTQRGMFNSAFAFGGGDDGNIQAAMSCTAKTVELLSGLKIDEVIMVNFVGFENLVNALGGINVYVKTPIINPNGLTIKDAGCKHMDGKLALDYARARHGIQGGDGSDLQRIGRQQEVMGIMFRTAIKKNILTDISSLYAFAKAGLSSLTVTSGFSSPSKIASFAWAIKGLNTDNILFVQLPVLTDPQDPNRVIENKYLASKLWRAIAEDAPLPDGIAVTTGSGKHYITGSSELETINAEKALAILEGKEVNPLVPLANRIPQSKSTPQATEKPKTDPKSTKPSAKPNKQDAIEEARRKCEP